MTRFDYFSDIEDHFMRLRGKALLVSPLDWELMQSWKDDGVPLHVVIASIEEVFKSHRERKARRPIGSLSYCKAEVEARFAEWKESRVGSNESEPGAVATGSSPFPKDAVIDYLRSTSKQLFTLTDAPDGLKFAIWHVTDKLDALSLGLRFAERVDAPNLELGLSTLEAILDCAIVAVSTPGQQAEARAVAEGLFEPYKDKMPEKVYEDQIERELKKRLRAIFGVPRLSLFHMK